MRWDAKPWIYQTDEYRLADRQTTEIFYFGGFVLQGGGLSIKNLNVGKDI
jgi:hypothetical protein